jgi:hypothetical protein
MEGLNVCGLRVCGAAAAVVAPDRDHGRAGAALAAAPPAVAAEYAPDYHRFRRNRRDALPEKGVLA